MRIVGFVLRRPYTVAAALIMVCLLALGAASRMPIDIFPEINIPVVSVVWTYNGMSAPDIQNRILSLHERQLASLVDDISRIEATSYQGVGVEKIYLHEGADVSRAVSQLASSALVVLKYMPPNITPPLVLRYDATDVPIIQLSLSSTSLPDTRLNDLGQNIIRPDLAVVHGAEVPQPYGGKPRVIMADLDQRALNAHGLSLADVSEALQRQNVILPSGDVKIGTKDYTLAMNNSPNVIDRINAFPIRQVDGRTVFMRDIAHVHDGFQVQTNSVSVDGRPGALITIRKTGGVSTLAVIDGIRNVLPEIEKVIPRSVSVKALFDQSIFVKAALNSVKMGGLMAAALTALMILLFLGNWRLTLIILAAIPLSIATAVLVLYAAGQTLNTMTLGGFALAVGILVDNGTVVIENIERHVRLGEGLEQAIMGGAGEVGVPTLLSTLCICIVFVPVFLLQGTAKYLFSPLSLSVCIALLASLGLSFTMVPVLFKYLMRGVGASHGPDGGIARLFAPFVVVQQGFEHRFQAFRESYRAHLEWALSRPAATTAFFLVLMTASLLLFPILGRDFFPQVDAGQMRLHVRAPAGTRIEQTQDEFAHVEAAIRKLVGPGQVDTVLDNIGLPYSGMNIALSDSATVGPMDGEILISLKSRHTPTAELVAGLRRELPRRFPELQFFFQPADIIDQVLNFGQPAPIDIRVSGPDSDEAYALAARLAGDIGRVPGIVDAHVFQVPSAPALSVDVDRALANQLGLDQRTTANDVLVGTNGSAQTAPNFWVDPASGVSYPLVVQVPTYKITTVQDLWSLPVTAGGPEGAPQLLMNVSSFGRRTVPLAMSQLNIRPVFDVDADVQGRVLDSAAAGIDKVIAADRPDAAKAITMTLSGQVETMREGYAGLFGGMALAVVLVYLFLVINFQSWIDPLIVLMAVPFALGGVMWMLFLTQTHLSIPALMGTLMCIGLTTANSILVVTFANQRMETGDDAAMAAAAAGYTRLRAVLMTAGAMIFGMMPMALGVGEGGEQNAPLARAVIGGLTFATLATLVFVPTMYRLLRSRRAKPAQNHLKENPMQSHDHDAHEGETRERPSRLDGGAGGPLFPHGRARMDRRMKRLAIVVALAFLAAFAVVEAARFVSARSLTRQTAALAAAPAVVNVTVVRPAANGPSLTLPGETHAWYESTIYARVTGYVAKWNVDIGDHVHKGQVLAEIETPELDAQLDAAQAKLKATQADVQVSEAQAEFARTTYARWNDAPKGVVSEQEREDKKAEFDSANARLASARAHVALDQADVDRYGAFEKFKRVTAPYDGTIIERRIDIGNLVTAGSSSGTTPLYRMTQDDPMRVWVDVPQTAASDLMKVGVPADIVTNQVPSRRFEGRIARTAAAINSQARTFRVEIDVPNANGALVSGMYVQAAFTLPANGLLQVPAAALSFRAAGPQVAVVGADGSIQLRSVSIARDDGSTVLLASGVASGEKVVLNLSSRVTEGQKVVVSEGTTDMASSAAAAPAHRR